MTIVLEYIDLISEISFPDLSCVEVELSSTLVNTSEHPSVFYISVPYI